MLLKNKVVLVTGGSSGIGLSIGELAKEKGANVIITGRDLEKLKTAADKFGFTAVRSDVSKEEDVLELFKIISKTHGSLDVLVNNAGFGYFDYVDNIKSDRFLDVFSTNVLGAALAAREAAKMFKKQNHGTIINIGSTASLKGFPGGTAYAATKFALRGMTECWRAELRPYNVRVIQINPSEVQTNFSTSSGRDEKEYNETKLIGPDVAHAVISTIEMHDRGFITELTIFATNPK